MTKILSTKFSKVASTVLFFAIALFMQSSEVAVTASKRPVVAKNGMVVSTQRVASEVGVEIMKRGGNAVDAAVAVSFALAVVHPSAGNIGGGGFMVIRKPDGEAITIDYREKAPGKANRDMYLDADGEVVRGLSTFGPLAAGVPGTVAGTLLALEKFGTMTPGQVLEPAIKLAERGFPLTRGLARGLNGRRARFIRFEETAAIFTKAEGETFEPGEIWKQKDLSNTLKEIAKKGHDGFYKGWVADRIVAAMKKYEGLISHEDLANYQAKLREPIKGTYRGYEIISMAPPSSGGIALMQLLNMVERYNIKNLGWNSSQSVHLITEAERRVYADRAEFLGDMDFVNVPIDKLISKEYAQYRYQDVVRGYATPSDNVTHGDVNKNFSESEETTHFSVIDKDGFAVSVTTTLNGGYGNHMVVGGAGFLLNNEMDDFSSKPGVPNMYGLLGSEANAIQPNKRMLSSMTPTIVVKDGKPFMIIGTPGGSTIITTVFQVIMNVIDHGMNISEAVNAPRFHHQWYPDQISHEKFALSFDTIRNLEMMGYTFRQRGGIGDAHGIIYDAEAGLFYGGADTRLEGEAVGY